MSSEIITSSIPVFGLTVFFDVFVFYAAYLSASVWQGLVVPIYRGRAIWLAAICLLASLAITEYGVSATLTPDYSSFLPALREFLYLLPLVAILIWIDRTMNAVIRLDYLRRDVLFWRRLHYVYGLIAVIGIMIYYARYVFAIPDAMTVGFALIFSQLIYGMLALARGATVTKDLIFKSHVKWFGLFLLAFIAAGFIYQLTYSGGSFVLPDMLCFTASGYCLFRMSKSLVPSGKLSSNELPASTPGP